MQSNLDHGLGPMDDEDDEVDNMELKLKSRKKSNRVYRSTPPEIGLKISRSLKMEQFEAAAPGIRSCWCGCRSLMVWSLLVSACCYSAGTCWISEVMAGMLPEMVPAGLLSIAYLVPLL